MQKKGVYTDGRITSAGSQKVEAPFKNAPMTGKSVVHKGNDLRIKTGRTTRGK